jgi:hypothetical protein
MQEVERTAVEWRSGNEEILILQTIRTETRVGYQQRVITGS